MNRRRRSAAVTLSAAFAALAGTVAGCSSSEEDAEFRRSCVEQSSLIREQDERCDGDGGGGVFVWFYSSSRYAVPAVGGRVDAGHGGFVKPGGSIGSVPRSGFGGRTSGGG